jgi:hypothetical protein
MLGATALWGDVQNIEEDNLETKAMKHFVNFVSNHRDYMVDTHNAVSELIVEGNERKSETSKAIQMLAKSNKIDMKGKNIPALKNGSNQLSKNVEFGEKAGKTSVKPEAVTKTFGDSADFAAKIATMFPKEYAKVT